MNKTITSTSIKLMITIVDRGNRDRVIQICKEEHLEFHYLCFGLGTASSELLDYLGFGETKKDVILSFVAEAKVQAITSLLVKKLALHRAGKGIVFTLPLTGISAPISKAICEECEIQEKGVSQMETPTHELVLVIMNQGYSDIVMEAARLVGATGGTILHARGIGNEESQKFLGISIQSEKEIVAILVKKEDKVQIMHEISHVAGLKTKAAGIVLALPVDSLMGLSE